MAQRGRARGAIHNGGETFENREGVEHGAQATEEALGTSGRLIAQGMHDAGEKVGRGMEATGDITRRSLQAASQGSRGIAQTGTEWFSEVSERIAEATKQSAEDLAMLMRLPGFGGGIEQIQHAISGVVTQLVETNTRATQDVLRVASPVAVIEMQQRMARRYIDGIINSSAEVFRVSRHLADEALRPVEERSRKMRSQGRSRHFGSSESERHTVSEIMTKDVEIARPDQSVQDVAQKMAEMNTGALPVEENDRLVGMVTDRDIAVRVAAEGKDPKETRVRDIMTKNIRYCFEDQDVEDIAENMAEQQVRRLPVVSRNKRLVGIVSLGDIATSLPHHVGGSALRGISQSADADPAYAGERPGRTHESG
jgi:CBS domain-containing protein